jgi:hypothetical protein
LKQEAFETKDAPWDDVKARAAANPAAVIAIGAGLAWRLLQRSPIASALIGVGPAGRDSFRGQISWTSLSGKRPCQAA